MSQKKSQEKPACSVSTAAKPTEFSCPGCGEKLEIWTDDDEVTCDRCGKVIPREAV